VENPLVLSLSKYARDIDPTGAPLRQSQGERPLELSTAPLDDGDFT